MASWIIKEAKPFVSESGLLLDAKDKLAKEIGKRISDLIVCPDCEKQGGALAEQKLAAEGDNEQRLFCPHCELTVEIVVRSLPYQ